MKNIDNSSSDFLILSEQFMSCNRKGTRPGDLEIYLKIGSPYIPLDPIYLVNCYSNTKQVIILKSDLIVFSQNVPSFEDKVYFQS